MNVQKNILDLHFYKYLQYKNTVIIMFFTYLIATLIPFLTGQLKFSSFRDVFLLILFSFVFFTIFILFFNKFDFHMKNILDNLKKLK